jgi:hypothetical protein
MAAEITSEVLLDDWQAVLVGQLTDRLAPPVLTTATRHWRRRNCRRLARLARAILKAKDKIHSILGDWVFRIWEWLGRPRFEQLVAKEVSKRIPIPTLDQKAVAIARSLQIIGIALCLHAGRGLASCACFKDVALIEGKNLLRRLFRLSLEDWIKLNRLGA